MASFLVKVRFLFGRALLMGMTWPCNTRGVLGKTLDVGFNFPIQIKILRLNNNKVLYAIFNTQLHFMLNRNALSHIVPIYNKMKYDK